MLRNGASKESGARISLTSSAVILGRNCPITANIGISINSSVSWTALTERDNPCEESVEMFE